MFHVCLYILISYNLPWIRKKILAFFWGSYLSSLEKPNKGSTQSLHLYNQSFSAIVILMALTSNLHTYFRLMNEGARGHLSLVLNNDEYQMSFLVIYQRLWFMPLYRVSCVSSYPTNKFSVSKLFYSKIFPSQLAVIQVTGT